MCILLYIKFNNTLKCALCNNFPENIQQIYNYTMLVKKSPDIERVKNFQLFRKVKENFLHFNFPKITYIVYVVYNTKL